MVLPLKSAFLGDRLCRPGTDTDWPCTDGTEVPFFYVALRQRKRGGLLGTGGGGGGGGERDIPGRPKETGETVDRRQNSMEVLRRCPALAIAQRLVHCAIAVSTAVFGQSQRQCPLLLLTQLEQLAAKEVQLSALPSSTSLLMISSGLSWMSSSTSLLISWSRLERPCEVPFLSFMLLYVHGGEMAYSGRERYPWQAIIL